MERIEQREEAPSQAGFDLPISQVLSHYRKFAQAYYVKDGQPTKELTELSLALRPLRRLYCDTLARDFGPLKLKAAVRPPTRCSARTKRAATQLGARLVQYCTDTWIGGAGE